MSHHITNLVLVPAPEVSLYVAGFPCTPYSSLGARGMLSDINSKQLLACVARMKACRPKATWPTQAINKNACSSMVIMKF